MSIPLSNLKIKPAGIILNLERRWYKTRELLEKEKEKEREKLAAEASEPTISDTTISASGRSCYPRRSS